MTFQHSRQPSGILGRGVFYLVKLWMLVLLKLYFRVRVENRPKLQGGFVMVANHASLLDPLVLGAVTSGWTGTHRVIFMMSSMMARSRALGWFYRWNRIIPVAPQGGNKAALRAAREVLDGGGVLGIFPEGGVSRDGQLMLGNPGAVSLGLAKNAPVLPVG
ncbi:MAG: lysophospholipid acyltransferase family protein, partial [Planctomycetota bacterium]